MVTQAMAWPKALADYQWNPQKLCRVIGGLLQLMAQRLNSVHEQALLLFCIRDSKKVPIQTTYF
jgi:hypothetical protein